MFAAAAPAREFRAAARARAQSRRRCGFFRRASHRQEARRRLGAVEVVEAGDGRQHKREARLRHAEPERELGEIPVDVRRRDETAAADVERLSL